MTLLVVSDPLVYLSPEVLRESQLLHFRMKSSERRLDIQIIPAVPVFEEWARHISSGGQPQDFHARHIEFRRLLFSGVSALTTELGPNVSQHMAPSGDDDVAWAAHEAKLISFRRLITEVDCISKGVRYRCRMYFDSFGAHSWEFDGVQVESVKTTVTSTDGEWQYFNSLTGAVVNPNNPFDTRSQSNRRTKR